MEKNPSNMVDGEGKMPVLNKMHSSLSLPEESDRTGCTLPSVRSFLWIHAGDAGSQDAQLGQREGDGSRTCGERERCSGCNQNREVLRSYG